MDAQVAEGKAAVAELVRHRAAGIWSIELAAKMVHADHVPNRAAAGDFQGMGNEWIAEQRMAHTDRLVGLRRGRRDRVAIFHARRQRLFDKDVAASTKGLDGVFGMRRVE